MLILNCSQNVAPNAFDTHYVIGALPVHKYQKMTILFTSPLGIMRKCLSVFFSLQNTDKNKCNCHSHGNQNKIAGKLIKSNQNQCKR